MKSTKMVAATLIFSLLLSMDCASGKFVKSEVFSNTNQKKYKNIFVSWINLHESRWKELGYASREVFAVETHSMNIDYFQDRLKKDLKDQMQVAFEQEKNVKIKKELYVRIYNTRLTRRKSPFDFDIFDTELSFTDLKTGKEIYHAQISIPTGGYSLYQNMGYFGIVLADIIKEKI